MKKNREKNLFKSFFDDVNLYDLLNCEMLRTFLDVGERLEGLTEGLSGFVEDKVIISCSLVCYAAKIGIE